MVKVFSGELRRKAQASVELLVILAVSLIVLLVIIKTSQDSIDTYDKTLMTVKSKTMLNKITAASDIVFQQGYGAKTKVYVEIPPYVKNITAVDKTLEIEFINGDKQYRNLDYDIVGEIPLTEGGYWIELQSMKGFVTLGTNVSEISGSYANCGNNLKEVGEDCDGTDLNGKDCSDFGFSFGTLTCDACSFDTSACSAALSEDCTDGIDNDGNLAIDCADPVCIGQLGPSGGICCAGNTANCIGDSDCVTCKANNECGNLGSDTLCNSTYLCSDSGDNSYDTDGDRPSQGYCDGLGHCDYSKPTTTCGVEEGGTGEGTSFSICQDGSSSCVDTCSDGVDNDLDGCQDLADSSCGAIELTCDDSIDNDCDGSIDCNDSDCNGVGSCPTENCTNGIDDDFDTLIDCDDSSCVGQIGPEGGLCCNGDDLNCVGDFGCTSCGANNECDYQPTTTVCDSDYLCSVGGSGGYGIGGLVPSQGYCNGTGGCDYASISPVCLSNLTAEGTGSSYCSDGVQFCIDSCSDGRDNDNDGCADLGDSNCGATESNCLDGIDNDCDSYSDCDDSDCSSQPHCNVLETDCTDGIDNEGDGSIDCDDSDCIGQTGPLGGICCDGLSSNCAGNSVCSGCSIDNECVLYDSSTACNLNYACSNSGDNGYDQNGRIPSQGYCDGAGNCDFALSTPLCTLGDSQNGEASGVTKCIDGRSACMDTCNDGEDNDLDGCFDYEDVDCGGSEGDCTDGRDNDCDLLIDCADPDCRLNGNCIPASCDARAECDQCLIDANCKWCEGGLFTGSGCSDACKTNIFGNCGGGKCYNSNCPI